RGAVLGEPAAAAGLLPEPGLVLADLLLEDLGFAKDAAVGVEVVVAIEVALVAVAVAVVLALVLVLVLVELVSGPLLVIPGGGAGGVMIGGVRRFHRAARVPAAGLARGTGLGRHDGAAGDEGLGECVALELESPEVVVDQGLECAEHLLRHAEVGPQGVQGPPLEREHAPEGDPREVGVTHRGEVVVVHPHVGEEDDDCRQLDVGDVGPAAVGVGHGDLEPKEVREGHEAGGRRDLEDGEESPAELADLGLDGEVPGVGAVRRRGQDGVRPGLYVPDDDEHDRPDVAQLALVLRRHGDPRRVRVGDDGRARARAAGGGGGLGSGGGGRPAAGLAGAGPAADRLVGVLDELAAGTAVDIPGGDVVMGGSGRIIPPGHNGPVQRLPVEIGVPVGAPHFGGGGGGERRRCDPDMRCGREGDGEGGGGPGNTLTKSPPHEPPDDCFFLFFSFFSVTPPPRPLSSFFLLPSVAAAEGAGFCRVEIAYFLFRLPAGRNGGRKKEGGREKEERPRKKKK
ncbi:MAG: hypothetical protein BJ554DRAFT_4844, partial [Olpidium bornovanus]